ncbi:DUF551 domain-containing protein [Klebsiella sp. RHBSTW-00215]|uniref:DUF551 domain-containing protein n=1 Tax=Klebsiella sp. RHBSTW-00215 TaxID=2742640 RepID=UPI001E5D3CF0|nr:DUF551 domain-containing protein [Klebsiella sp. RHBSTW-00215]
MTNNQLTRERIELIANFHRAMTLPPSHDEIEELARMALVAMDSEPVAWISQSNLDALSRGHDALVKSTDNVVQPVPLYRHAQPAPVVPEGLRMALSNAGIAAPESDEMLAATHEKYVQALVMWVRDRKPFQPAPVVQDERAITQHFDTIALETAREILCDVNRRHEFLGGDVQLLSRIQCRIDEACRAAMLAATPQPPGSEPATLPGKWIPVSERMPENGVSVLTFDGMYRRVHHAMYGHWQCREPEKITHWMPLPAAPQEVNHG